MELLNLGTGPLIGLIGWAATALAVLGWTRLTPVEQRAMIVFAWTLWTIPALGVLVYRGVIEINAAMLYCGATTAVLALFVSLATHRWRTRP